MRTALILALGLSVGWLARELTLDRTRPQTASRTSGIRDSAGWHGSEEAEEPGSEAPPLAESPPEPEGKRAPGAEAAGPTAHALTQFIRSQGPIWKAGAVIQAKPKVRALAAALGFDAATQKRIEEELMAEVDAQLDRALRMLRGEEDLDITVLDYFFGMPAELNTALEKRLATFLSDEDVAALREQVAVTHKIQQRDMADAEIGMMDISDLSEGQRAEMRDIFEGRNFLKDQLARLAKVTRNPGMLQKMLAGGEEFKRIMRRNMDQQFEPTRNSVRVILRDDQFKRYEAYEKKMIQQVESGLGTIRAMSTTGGR